MKTLQLTIAILLFPLSIWYAVGVAVRNIYYSRRTKTANGRQPAISIGNLRMGGTGKTPHTEYLIRLLGGSGTAVALLSRGYGRKTKGFLLADASSKASDIGDEPLMMHRKFPDITVAVCEDRNEGIKKLSTQASKHSSIQAFNIVLLDDCYQHRKVTPDLNILLTQYSDLYVDDHVLPFGNLREFRSGSRRADIIIVTKCPPYLSTRKRDTISHRINPLPHQRLFFSYISYSDPVPLFSPHLQFSHFNAQLLLVSGIANPEPLKRHLERHSTVANMEFPDHHKFTHLDCEMMLRRFNNLKSDSKAIVTTEKDAMRLIDSPHRHLFDDIPFFYVPIEVKFFEQNDFDNTILNFFHNFANSNHKA